MRNIGLCLLLLVIPAGCDDAVGSGYPDATSGAFLESKIESETETPPQEALSEEPASEIAEAGERTSPEKRAAMLGLTQEVDYTCNKEGVTAHVVIYGNEEVTAVLVPGVVNGPLYLDCSRTRIGPECSDGQFTAHINTLDDTAMFYELKDASPLTCALVQPELPPETGLLETE